MKTEQEQIDEIIAKVSRENRDREAASPEPTEDEARKLAAFLWRWTKGPITRQSADATFWCRKGGRATKLTFREVNAMVKLDLATVDRDPRLTGAVLQLRRVTIRKENDNDR